MSKPRGGGLNNGQVLGVYSLSRARAARFASQNGVATLDRLTTQMLKAACFHPRGNGMTCWRSNLESFAFASEARSWCTACEQSQGGCIHWLTAARKINRFSEALAALRREVSTQTTK